VISPGLTNIGDAFGGKASQDRQGAQPQRAAIDPRPRRRSDRVRRRFRTLLTPYPAEEMTRRPEIARVGDVKNNDPSLIEPFAVKEPA
jgi:hypothetical protein